MGVDQDSFATDRLENVKKRKLSFLNYERPQVGAICNMQNRCSAACNWLEIVIWVYSK